MRASVRAWTAAFGIVIVAPAATSAQCPTYLTRPDETLVRCEAETPLEEVLERARRHLAAGSNPTYQVEHFVFMPEKWAVQRRNDCRGEAVAFELDFEFLPLTRLGSDRPWFHLSVPADPRCEVVGNVRLLSADGTIVEPKVTRTEAVSIALRDGNAPVDTRVSYAVIVRTGAENTGWKWELDFGECAVERLEIDAVSGALLVGLPKFDPFAPRTIRSYPFVASEDRATRIRSRFHDVTTGMIPSGVKSILGEPDEIGPLYKEIKNGEPVGHMYFYVLRRMRRDGSAREIDEEVVRVSFDLEGKVTRVDHWGERPSGDRS